MFIIFAYIILLGVYAACPFLLQAAGFVLNAMYPDPIPFMDEFIMIVCMITRIEKITNVLCAVIEFVEDHRVILLISGGIIAVIVVMAIYYKSGGVLLLGR